jgi:hypothetical protein
MLPLSLRIDETGGQEKETFCDYKLLFVTSVIENGINNLLYILLLLKIKVTTNFVVMILLLLLSCFF